MNLKFLETFIWVARLSSFSGAARRMHATQAAVSNRIGALERELGIRLFERDLRSVRLTPEGKEALAKAEQIIRFTNEFVEGARDRRSFHGVVTIGTIDAVVHAWLPRLIDGLKHDFPRVACNLVVDTSFNIIRQLNDGEIDIGIIVGPVHHDAVENICLGRFTCEWIASSALNLRNKRLTLRELSEFPILSYPKVSQMHRVVQELLDDAGVARARIYNSNSITTIVRLLTDGIGVAPLPLPSVRDLLATEVLEILDVTPTFPDMVYHAAFHKRPDMPLPALIARMAAEVAASYADEI
ncbi:LysR family transcriptional regulator [Pseudorhodoplanes sp.]|uniref:LysR family transcriptional regulator n=1 Tax=Pseudorhodoplanes sp. TaxID=1934341 RepID=UPI003D0B28B2